MGDPNDVGKSLEAWLIEREANTHDGLHGAGLPFSLFRAIPRDDRPAFPFDQGTFMPDAQWAGRVTPTREILANAGKAVGNIIVDGPTHLRFPGTGFLISYNTLVTNLHVVRSFMQFDGAAWRPKIPLGNQLTARVCFAEKLADESPINTVEITSVLFWDQIQGSHRPSDLAVCGLAYGLGIEPLSLAGECPESADAACIGFPSSDEPTDAAALARLIRVFGRRYQRKHLSPGTLRTAQEVPITHDCSTNPGHSGSPLLDLYTGEVLAIHYGGSDVFNAAIPVDDLWRIMQR